MSFLVLSVFAPFFLEFHLNHKVSIEIQGLSTIDCNFQGLLRPCGILMLKFKDFQDFQGVYVRCNIQQISRTSYVLTFHMQISKKMLLVAVGIHSLCKITFTWLQHFLSQYLDLHGGKRYDVTAFTTKHDTTKI